MTNEWNPADCWFLTGPTASGKTTIGIELARRLGAEIISLDSMAIYRGMDIGTAKPTPAQRAMIPHHLIDLVDPETEFSAFQYFEAARAKTAEIRAQGHEVLYVGGTPLYLKALLRGLFRGPAADWEFRRQLEEELQEVGHEALYRRVALIDPLSAAKLHPNDTRRLIRALEVYRSSGQPISHQQTQFEDVRPAEACRAFALEWPRPELHARIARRVDAMFAAGLVDEVRHLTRNGRQLGRTASQAVGYREVIQLLAGDYDLAEAREKVAQRTRRFAKRQMTWFRSLSECRRVAVSESSDPADVATQITRLAECR